jgi:hypothetical protein
MIEIRNNNNYDDKPEYFHGHIIQITNSAKKKNEDSQV